MKIAYLVNQYPKISHSFIRREIAALEEQGLCITRFAIRSCAAELVDPADLEELSKTEVVLDQPLPQILFLCLGMALQSPWQWLMVLGRAIALSRHADRSGFHYLAYFVEACVIVRWCQRQHIDHLHAHFGTNSATVALLSRWLGGPSYSFTVHGPEEFDRAIALNLPEKITHATFVVAISSFGRSQLYRLCDYTEWSKIRLIHCGVDQQFLLEAPVAIPEAPRLVCIGRLCEQKGQPLLIEAIRHLHQTGNIVELSLLGDGPLRPTLECLIRQYGLEKHVHLVGWATEQAVRDAILQSRALVQPSFAEGLPVVLMEGLGLGRPVISTYVAGIPELVNPKVSGWLVPAGSVEALVDAIRALLDTPVDELLLMGIAGSNTVRQQHNIRQEAKALAHLFYRTCPAPIVQLQFPSNRSESDLLQNHRPSS